LTDWVNCEDEIAVYGVVSGYELYIDADDGGSYSFDEGVEEVIGCICVAESIDVLFIHIDSIFLLISFEEGFFIEYFGEEEIVNLWSFSGEEYSNG
jgi:hypothetical protein